MGAKAMELPMPVVTQTAVFGLGCFWGPDGQFPGEDGVTKKIIEFNTDQISPKSFFGHNKR